MSNNVKVNAKKTNNKPTKKTKTKPEQQPHQGNSNSRSLVYYHSSQLANITELVFTWQAIGLFPTGKRRYINSRDGY